MLVLKVDKIELNELFVSYNKVSNRAEDFTVEACDFMVEYYEQLDEVIEFEIYDMLQYWEVMNSEDFKEEFSYMFNDEKTEIITECPGDINYWGLSDGNYLIKWEC